MCCRWRGLGNRFFEYVVNSGFGGGKWLNQNDNINVVGLDGWDNLVTLIEYASGWCGQYESESDCTYRAECGSEFNKGTDPIVYALMKNSTADAYLKYATKTRKVYCDRKDRDNPDYLTRFKNKHMGVGAEPGLLGSKIMVANKPYSNSDTKTQNGDACVTYSASISGTTNLYAHPDTNEVFFKNDWKNSYLGGYKTGEYVKGTDNKTMYKCISAIPEAVKWSDKEMSVNGYGYIARPIVDDKGNLIRYEIYKNNSYYPYSFDTWDKNKQYKNGDITRHAVGEVAHLFKNVYTSSVNPITWDKKSIDISNGRYIVVGTGKDRKYYKYIGTKRLYFVSWEKDHTYYKGDLVKDGNATYTALVSNPDKTKKPSANKTEWEKSTSYTYKEPANDKDNWLAVSCFSTSKDYTNDLWEDLGKLADLKPNKNTEQWSYCYDLVNPSKDTTHWTSVNVDNSLGNMFADNAKYILFPKTVAFTAQEADNGGVQGAPARSTKNLTTMKIETSTRTIPQKDLSFSPGYFGFKPKMDSSGRAVIKDGKIVSSGDYDYEVFFLKGNNPKYSFVGTDGNTYTGTYSGTDTQWDTNVSAKQIGTALYLGDLEMSSSERKTAELVINLSSTQYEYYNALGYGGGSTTATIDFPNWCYTIRAPKDCAIKGHKYTSKVVWESEVRKGVTHYPRAHFEHVCEKCLHTLEPEKADVGSEPSADGKQITYKCTDPRTGQEFRRVVFLGGQTTGHLKLHGNTKITGSPKDHPCMNESTGTNTVHAAGSKSQAKWGGIYKDASTSVSFTIPAGYIQAGAQSITLKYAYSENLEDLNILLKDRNGNTIATNKNHGTMSSKIDLSKGYIDDSKLNGAYLTVDARVSTKTYAATDDSEPADAYTFIRFDTLDIGY